MKKFSLFVCFLFFHLLLPGQDQPDLHFEQLTEENGLSNGFVTSIYQDEKGFLWFGTANGLNRYDGYQFKTWAPEENNPNSLSNPIIWTLYGSTDGAIWIGTEKGLNRFDPRTEQFTRYLNRPFDECSLGQDLVTAICEDKNGNLWVGTGNGISILEKKSGLFSQYFLRPAPAEGNGVRSIVRDEKDRMWFGLKDTLYCFDFECGDLGKFALPFSGKPEERSTNFLKTIYQEDADHLWLSTDINGIYHFDTRKLQFTSHFKNNPADENSLRHNRISSFLQDEYGNLWIGSYEGGLNILDSDRKRIYRFPPDPFNPAHQKFDVVRSMFRDRTRNIWLGTFYGGAKAVLKHKKPFINYVPIPGKPAGLGDGQAGQLALRPDGTIWIPVDGWGLALFNPHSETFTRFAPKTFEKGNLGSKNVLSALEDKNGDLWVITFTEIWKMDGRTGWWTNMQPSGMPQKSVWLLSQFKDSQGVHWIGTQGGLFRYDRSANALIQHPLNINKGKTEHGENTYIESFFENKNGDLWIGTHGGLNHRPPGSNEFIFYPFHQQILSVLQDRAGTIWLGVIGGLAFFNSEQQKIEFHPKAKSFSGKLVHSLLEDKSGRLWMGSKAGLIRFDPATGASREYNQKDGLANRQFLGAHLESQSGEFYFGGTKGLLRFHPDNIRDNPIVPPVVLTNFQLHNKDMPILGSIGDTLKWKSPLTKNIAYTDSIRLLHWQNDFAFEFAALDFTAPMNNRYQFMLEGYDNAWVETDAGRRFAQYTNLNPGKYTFKVMGSNSDGKWNKEPTSVHIRIFAPWWATWWAYLLYFTGLAGLLMGIRNYELKRKFARLEARRLEELDAVKSNFYVNITHEFRTPLTIIIGFADQLKALHLKSIHPVLDKIIRNGERLLHLVNQMLDLSKLESNRLELQPVQGDIVKFLKYLGESFHSLADAKNIRIHFQSDLKSQIMDYDPERVQQIYTNLLSNAIKFTEKNGAIYVRVYKESDRLYLQIEDTGIGIAPDVIPHIFDRFYQGAGDQSKSGAGTGIGLTVVHELVKLMDGRITVTSELGKGTVFTISLPITNLATKVAVSTTSPKKPSQAVSKHSKSATKPDPDAKNKPLVLIIEDNEDVVDYLVLCLQADYRLLVSNDGNQGIEKARATVPDLIISDVMMPGKDGFEVCQTLKTDERTSHIPIILLTAKADLESRLIGLRRGADAYLAKPFNKEELLVHIRNLLEVRQKLQAHYRGLLAAGNQGPTPAKAPLEQVMEHAFIQKIKTLLEKDLILQWEVPDLAYQLHISVSQLHRKLAALTGMHTTEFVRYIRLVHARDLLLQRPEEKISAVAYDVGFKSPNEFSRRFKEVFGMTPAEWRESGVGK